MEKKYCVVSTTVDTEDAIHKLANLVIESRMAACAQISGPVKSIYWWDNKKEQAEEWTCSFKTTVDQYPNLEKVIREHHPYDVPEIILTPILNGHPDYLEWISAETNQ